MAAEPPADPHGAATFAQMIRAAAAAYGEAPAVVLRGAGAADETASFAALERDSAYLARALLAHGAGKGSRIGLLCGNGPFFAAVFAAIARIGAVAIPFSTMARADELVGLLRQSDIGGLIAQRRLLGHDLAARLTEALPELCESRPALRLPRLPYLRWIVSEGAGLAPAIGDLAGFAAAAETVSEALLRAVESEIHPSDQLVEIYTSGSMAAPKGVRHLHGPVMARCRTLARMTGRVPGAEVAALMPMFWVGGLGLYLLASWMAGSTTICTARTLSNSRLAMGSVLADEDLLLMGQARPYWALGMSETFGPYSYGDELRAPLHPLCAPLDHILDGFELRLADEQDRAAADGAVGEIQIRGEAVTPGLHKITRAANFTPDGFLRTGDLGRREGARIHFTGRRGDMIKTAGANVSPAEVELELQRQEGVHNAYVLGLPDAERGQIVVAALVPREGAAPDVTRIEAALRARLSPYKVPRAFVALTHEEIPLLPSNKVARRALATLLAQKLGRNEV